MALKTKYWAWSLGLFIACGDKATDEVVPDATSTITEEEVTDGTTAETTSAVVAANPLAQAYPGGLAISVFSQSVDSTALTSGDQRLSLAEELAKLDKKTQDQKVDDANKRLIGEGDCFGEEFVKDRPGFGDLTCYEFDSEMAPFKGNNGPGGGTEYGTVDGTDGKGEACLVAFARSQMTQVVASVEKAMFMVEAMMCQSKKAAKENGTELILPSTAGEKLDLKAVLETATKNTSGMSITSADITMLEPESGRQVFYNHIVMKDPSGRTVDINLVHSPAADGSNDTYNGTLWTIESGGTTAAKLADPVATTQAKPATGTVTPSAGGAVAPATGGAAAPAAGGATGAGASASTKKKYLHINYSRVTEDGLPRLKMELRRAHVEESLNPITTDGELNLNIGADLTGTSGTATYGGYGSKQSNEIIDGMKLIRFDMNPDTNEGKLDYWVNPGGNYYENARGFVFDLKNDGTTVSGCAVSGAAHYGQNGQGISIRRSLYEGGDITLTPRGFYHPFADNNLTTKTKDTRQLGQFGTTISKQCFAKNVASGLYEIDKSKTTSSLGFDVIETAASGITPPKVSDAKPVKGAAQKAAEPVKATATPETIKKSTATATTTSTTASTTAATTTAATTSTATSTTTSTGTSTTKTGG